MGTRARFYERRKRDIVLACLPRPSFRRAFEPGCATGALSVALAERCDELVAWDVAAAAVDRLRRTAPQNVIVEQGGIPDRGRGRVRPHRAQRGGLLLHGPGRLVRTGSARRSRATGWWSPAIGVVPAPDHPATAEQVHDALAAGLRDRAIDWSGTRKATSCSTCGRPGAGRWPRPKASSNDHVGRRRCPCRGRGCAVARLPGRLHESCAELQRERGAPSEHGSSSSWTTARTTVPTSRAGLRASKSCGSRPAASARRAALGRLTRCAASLAGGFWLASTDADSQVPVHWLTGMVGSPIAAPMSYSGPSCRSAITCRPRRPGLSRELRPPTTTPCARGEPRRPGSTYLDLGGWPELATGEDHAFVGNAIRAGGGGSGSTGACRSPRAPGSSAERRTATRATCAA